MKCRECLTQKKADNCQSCYILEKENHKRSRQSLERQNKNFIKGSVLYRKEYTKRENKYKDRIIKELRGIIEDKRLFQTRHLLFNFVEDLAESKTPLK